MSISVKNSSGDWVQCAGNGTLYADAPLGTILAYGGSTAPTGWFLCQGQAISRTTYSELFAVIGTSFGSGDGSTTFNIPDLREATTKGVGLSGESNNHYDSAGLTLGEFIDDRVQDHVHNTYLNGDLNYPFGTKDGGDTNIQFANVDRQEGAGWNVKANTIYTGRHGATTEVKAVGVNYIIKARMAAIPTDFISEIEEVVEENIVDSVTDGNMKAVTSNAVYDALQTMPHYSNNSATVELHGEVSYDDLIDGFSNVTNLAGGHLYHFGFYHEGNDSNTNWVVGTFDKLMTFGKPNEFYDTYSDGIEQTINFEPSASASSVNFRFNIHNRLSDNTTLTRGFSYVYYKSSNNLSAEITDENGNILYEKTITNSSDWASFSPNLNIVISQLHAQWLTLTIEQIF